MKQRYGPEAPHASVIAALCAVGSPAAASRIAAAADLPEAEVVRALHALEGKGIVRGERLTRGRSGTVVLWSLVQRPEASA